LSPGFASDRQSCQNSLKANGWCWVEESDGKEDLPLDIVNLGLLKIASRLVLASVPLEERARDQSENFDRLRIEEQADLGSV
jgi:hypothetical protein